MTETELLQQIALGEDSRRQFKRNIMHPDALAAELVAFSNSGGGTLLIGVNDDGSIAGLDAAEVRRINQLLSNAASQHLCPPVHPLTENICTRHGLVIVVSIPDGLAKPYLDHQGRIWVKQGADKRHVTAREEMQRMFQRSGLVRADVVPMAGTSAQDVDEKAFSAYVARRYGPEAASGKTTLDQVLHNIGLGDGREPNLSGVMLFGRNPQRCCPAFIVKAVAFPGTVIWDTRYLDSEDIGGTLADQFKGAFAFLKRNLHHIQRGRGFNTLGELEIPEAALEELLVNALVHRDYFTSASIRIMVFADRVEIISPGHLPDSLSVEDVRQGKTNRRNPTLTEHAFKVLPYRGLGSGIPRALEEWPRIELIDDVRGNQFTAVMWRPNPEWEEVTGQVTGQVTEEIERLLRALVGEMSRQQIQDALSLKHRDYFEKAYLKPALDRGLIEMTIPDKPRSRLQKYRLTETGQRLLQQMQGHSQP
ncbi:MAG: putative DNA binding domain-containing protein [Azoarcus sp.]|nr:putative DNA binding domain-containing protein [Azoarcus sp.]